MHRARAFFFVCAGLLCLALAYHLGARSAKAQAGACIVAASIDPWGGGSGGILNAVAATQDRIVYYNGNAVGGGPVPGTSPIVAVGSSEFTTGVVGVILDDGSVYGVNPEHEFYTWHYFYNLMQGSCGATQAAQPTWGQVKAKYATPAPGKVTR